MKPLKTKTNRHWEYNNVEIQRRKREIFKKREQSKNKGAN